MMDDRWVVEQVYGQVFGELLIGWWMIGWWIDDGGRCRWMLGWVSGCMNDGLQMLQVLQPSFNL